MLNNENTDYKNIEYTDNLISKIQYKIDIDATDKNTKKELKGFITTDISNACINNFQNAINTIYAYYVYDKKDARSLKDEDKTNLQCSFYIREGTTDISVLPECIKEIINSLSNLPMQTQLSIIAGIVVICGFYFGYKIIDSNNQAKKFIDNNKMISDIVKNNNETIIKALSSDKMVLNSVKYNNEEPISGDKIYSLAKELNNKQNNKKTKQKEEYKLIVKKLYNSNNKEKKAILQNKDNTIKIDADFVNNLFQENKDILIQSFTNDEEISCEVLITRNEDNDIVDATLLKVSN